MHNKVHQAFERAHQLPRQEAELTEDVSTLRDMLVAESSAKQARAEQRRAEQFHWISAFASAFLGGLTAFTLADELFPLMCDTAATAVLLGPACADTIAEKWLTFAVTAVITAVAGVLVYAQGPDKPEAPADPLSVEFQKEFLRRHNLRKL